MPPAKVSNGAHILDVLLAILPVWVHDHIRGDQQCTYTNRRRPVFIHRRRVPFNQSTDHNEGRDKGSSNNDSKGPGNSNGFGFGGFGGFGANSNGAKDSTSNDSTDSSDSPLTTGSDIFCQFCIADNDARVLYNGPWSLNGAGPSNTTHSTSTAGSTVSLSFNGSGIIVFGTVLSSSSSSKPPTTSFTVDAAAPFVTTEPQTEQAFLNQPLFVASELSKEEHKIVINVTDAGSASPFVLDYFFISPHLDSTSNTEATISFPPTSSSSSPTPFASAIKSTTSSTTSDVSSVARDSIVVIKVLAALLGVLFLTIIFLIAFLVIYIRKSKIRRGPSIPRSYKSRASHQGTLLTTTESIMRNFTPSLIWSYSRSESGSGNAPSPALPGHSAKSQRSEARSVWSAT
ncbi:hypothetical protein EDD85DRAFT_567628 [Armillaria nabsnona]|nr:hypothetical protein EDD85DRAFT_567628 [Armillaria nabsnona]